MKLFVFCGIDGSGKDSLINYVYDCLFMSYRVVKLRQPGSDGKRVFLSNENYTKLQLLGLAYDYQQQIDKVIKPLSKTDSIILCSRWFPICSQVYQGEIARRFIECVDVIEPNLTFYVKCPVIEAYGRKQNKDSVDSDLAKQYQVSENYGTFFENTLLNYVMVSNGNAEQEQAKKLILETIKEKIK